MCAILQCLDSGYFTCTDMWITWNPLASEGFNTSHTTNEQHHVLLWVTVLSVKWSLILSTELSIVIFPLNSLFRYQLKSSRLNHALNSCTYETINSVCQTGEGLSWPPPAALVSILCSHSSPPTSLYRWVRSQVLNIRCHDNDCAFSEHRGAN